MPVFQFRAKGQHIRVAAQVNVPNALVYGIGEYIPVDEHHIVGLRIKGLHGFPTIQGKPQGHTVLIHPVGGGAQFSGKVLPHIAAKVAAVGREGKLTYLQSPLLQCRLQTPGLCALPGTVNAFQSNDPAHSCSRSQKISSRVYHSTGSVARFSHGSKGRAGGTEGYGGGMEGCCQKNPGNQRADSPKNHPSLWYKIAPCQTEKATNENRCMHGCAAPWKQAPCCKGAAGAAWSWGSFFAHCFWDGSGWGICARLLD